MKLFFLHQLNWYYEAFIEECHSSFFSLGTIWCIIGDQNKNNYVSKKNGNCDNFATTEVVMVMVMALDGGYDGGGGSGSGGGNDGDVAGRGSLL